MTNTKAAVPPAATRPEATARKMLCCVAGITAALAVPVWWRRLLASFGRTGFAAVMVVPLVLAAFVAEHLMHYASRAEANERSILAEIAAAPLCTGSGDRTLPVTAAQDAVTPIASARSS
ncbi:hypothetical protein [Parvibaculum sp.]|uniref:hypothetical protein n=1 Tax=Parvibaculum sp. TaxID=2024848 RepID=UPI0032EF013F